MSARFSQIQIGNLTVNTQTASLSDAGRLNVINEEPKTEKLMSQDVFLYVNQSKMKRSVERNLKRTEVAKGGANTTDGCWGPKVLDWRPRIQEGTVFV